MTTAREVLLAAADRLEKPGAWIQGAFARDASGFIASYNSPMAVSWCAIGALKLGCGSVSFVEVAVLLTRVIRGRQIRKWNDAECRTQAEVVAALRKAAEIAT
jgi:hypothetical protein